MSEPVNADSSSAKEPLFDRFLIVAVVLSALSFVSYAINLSNINDLPAHPLLVHIPVVLLPLVAIASVPIVWYGPWRRRFLPALIITAIVTFFFSVLSVNAGEALQRAKNGGGPLIQQHAEYGDKVPVHALLLLVALLLVRLAAGYGKQWLLAAISAFTMVTAAYGFYAVYQAGDSGARSVWHGESASGGNMTAPPGSKSDD